LRKCAKVAAKAASINGQNQKPENRLRLNVSYTQSCPN